MMLLNYDNADADNADNDADAELMMLLNSILRSLKPIKGGRATCW